jgi:hypothetical protein
MSSKKDSQNFYDIGCRAKNLFLYDVAIKYLEQTAALGNVEALIELGDIFCGAGSSDDLHKLEEIIQSDNSKALKFYRQAAEKNYAPAFNRLALMNLNECNVEETYKYFQLAVETYKEKLDSGFNAFTLKTLAKTYEDLYFVVPDKRKSKKLLQKFLEYYKLAFGMFKNLANEGNMEAFFELGEMYRIGNFMEKSHSNAIKMFENAAKLGSTDDKICAYINIAFICKSEENYNQFIDYIKKAAELGDFFAMRQLWEIFERGEFVSKNLSESEKWLKKSEEIQSEFLKALKREDI